MKILVCGMPRSMTTWAFNVISTLLAGREIGNLWIAPDSPEERRFVEAPGLVLAKCHHYRDELARAADVVVYSYRDIRAAAVSYRRKFGSRVSREQLDAWVEAERRWVPHADVVLRYEDVERDPVAGVEALRAALVRHAQPGTVSQAPADRVLGDVDQSFDAMQETRNVQYDSGTMILPQHRTFQPPPEELDAGDRALYDQVDTDFRGWLGDHGYVEREDHGQDVEYRLAQALLRLFPAPVVVDVGVERGSFVALALAAGAARVIGFEPLPRHVGHLATRFGSNAAVKIHPMALSSTSGTAKLHIATDRQGRELDYHHSLSDLGDSATVVRTQREIEVRTAAIADLVSEGTLPADIDLLKIDTDGHDLEVLHGLGACRPRIVIVEYWDELPDTSGRSPYRVEQVWDWARTHGYDRLAVVRRHGRIELLQQQAPWSVPGDWGNLFLVRSDLPAAFGDVFSAFGYETYSRLVGYTGALVHDIEAKEAEIRRLDGAARQLRSAAEEKEAEIGRLAGALEEARAAAAVAPPVAATPAPSPEAQALHEELMRKEAVIRELSGALEAYRRAYGVMRPLLAGARSAVRGVRRFTWPLKPKLGVLDQHPPIEIRIPDGYAAARAPDPAPRISLVTPSFRQAAFIGATIESVLGQGYPNLEYRVQDGGSDDGTVAILERHAARLSGWESRRDEGQAQAINLAFAHTGGEIMGWLNSDDLLLPGALAAVADYFVRHPEVDALYGDRILIDEEGREIGRWVMPPHDDGVLSWADYVPQETLFWRRRLWDRAGAHVDESYRFAMDWELLVRFRAAGARFAHLPRFLGAFRVHAAQKTSAAIAKVGFEEMNRVRLAALGRVPSPLEIRRAVAPFLLRHVASDLRWRIAHRLGRA